MNNTPLENIAIVALLLGIVWMPFVAFVWSMKLALIPLAVASMGLVAFALVMDE